MCFILNIFSRLKRVEERLDLLEYHEPESLEKFVEKHQYEKIDDLYYLDRKYFIRQLHNLNCGFLEDYVNSFPKYKYYVSGDIVGKIYEDYLFCRKQDMFEENIKNETSKIKYNIGEVDLKKVSKKTVKKSKKIVKGGKKW